MTQKTKDNASIILPINVREPAARKFRGLAAHCGLTQKDLFGMIVHSMHTRIHFAKTDAGLDPFDNEHDPQVIELIFERDMRRMSHDEFLKKMNELTEDSSND